jgi:hypothetical protein
MSHWVYAPQGEPHIDMPAAVRAQIDEIGAHPSAADKVVALRHYLTEYNLRTLVETGLYYGGGSGGGCLDLIDTYIVCDFQPDNIDKAKVNYPGCVAILGDSAETIPKVVDDLGGPALFWLDAHGIPDDADFPPCPLFAELAAIAASPFPHVILIDDLVMMIPGAGTPLGQGAPTLQELRDYVDGLGLWDRSDANEIMRLTPKT